MRRRQPKALRVVAVSSVVLAGVAAALVPGAQWRAGSAFGVLVLVLAALGLVAGELLVVTLPIARGKQWRFAGVEVALAAAVLHVPGVSLWLVALVAAVVVLAFGRSEGRSARTAEYGAATAVAAAGVAAATCAGLLTLAVPRLEAAGLAVLAAGLVRHVLAAVAVALTARRPVGPLIRRRLPTSAVQAVGNATIGLLAGELAAREPLGLAGLLVPALLLASSYEQQVRRAAQAGLYAELARAQERAGTRSVDASAEIVLTVAARMLGGADLEMLLHGSDGLVRYLGNEAGLRARRRVDPKELDAPWVLRLLASGGVRLSRDAGRPECAVCIGPAATPTALLLARRSAGAPGFSRREAALVRALAVQTEPWLAGAVEADGPVADPEGFEGLADIREAARRVLSLADVTRFDPDELVGELHALERTVAQLVGTARGAVGDAGDPAVPAPRRSTDWTTTGRLS